MDKIKFWFHLEKCNMRIAHVSFLITALLCVFSCSMQEGLFDLAGGNNMVLAIGYDGSTTKILSVEPDMDHYRVYDTGIATVPFPGAVVHAHEKVLWFLIGSVVYKLELEGSSAAVSVLSPGSAYAFGRSDDGNVVAWFGSDVYTILKDGSYAIVGSLTAPTAFFQDVFFRGEGGGLIIDQFTDNIYRVSSSSFGLYATVSYTPAVVGSQSYLKRVNGEFFIGTSGGYLYRDSNSNGTNFNLANTPITPLSSDYGISYSVISSSLWYIAYQSATNTDIVVVRYDNGVPSTVVSIPTTGMAYLFLRHYRDDTLILGVGNTASVNGLYIVDAGSNSYSAISTEYIIYGLSRVDE